MSTIEDFKNAPVGATAIHPLASRAMKTDNREGSWVTPRGNYFSDEGMVNWGYTLDPLEPCPASAREALDLAWELAHEVKVGQVIPEGARYLEFHNSTVKEYIAYGDREINVGTAPITRTLEPLPEQEPDWLDAPAVMARLKSWASDHNPQVFRRETESGAQWSLDTEMYRWDELIDGTPLYPKGQDGLNPSKSKDIEHKDYRPLLKKAWEEGHEAAAMRVPEEVWHDTASPRTPNPYRQETDA